jgi:hypothetical protein
VNSWAGERKSEIGKQRKKEKGGLVKESQKRKTEKKEEGPLVKKVRNRSQRKKKKPRYQPELFFLAETPKSSQYIRYRPKFC